MDAITEKGTKWNFKLDLEAVTRKQMREPLMKYKTMGDQEENKDVIATSESYPYEESELSDPDFLRPLTTVNSARDSASANNYPKLLKVTPRKPEKNNILSDSKRLNYNSSSIYFNGARCKTLSETEYSDSDVRSLRSKKEIQKETLNSLLSISSHFICIFIS